MDSLEERIGNWIGRLVLENLALGKQVTDLHAALALANQKPAPVEAELVP